MDQDDIPQVRDIPAAIGLLSRLPVSVDTDRATARGAQAAWAYPVAGMAIAVFACLIGETAQRLGLSSLLVAGLTLASLVIISGAMHEDGLADSADGLWGGWDKARRLEIMKDSHIGAYGVIALALSLGLRWGALSLLIDAGALWPAVLATAAISRASMVSVMHHLPNARDGGLSRSVGRPTRMISLIAALIAVVFCLLLLASVWPVVTACLAAFACALIARAKIGGQTGDILGATQQITEITVLLTLVVMLG